MSLLESNDVEGESEFTYTKQISSQDGSEAKILALDWNKGSEKISVIIVSMKEKKATKRNINVFCRSIIP